MAEVKIEFQWFHGCPNSETMLKRVREAAGRSDRDIDLVEVLVETPEKAREYRFRGSPTVLINNRDITGMEEPAEPSLACRYYPGGLPEVDDILRQIEQA